VALTAPQVAIYGLPTAPAKASDGRSKKWSGGTEQVERERSDRTALLRALPAGEAP